MKVLFAGPSIHGITFEPGDIIVRPPASRGDIAAAVRRGATHIALVDGYFSWTASVWHKEILFALQAGVVVIGAASMGALRAAECASFGMVPIGRVAHGYLDGTLDDDGDVAILHCPAELDYAPLTEALVDVRATLERLVALGRLTAAEHLVLSEAAGTMNFRDRTVEAMVSSLPLPVRAVIAGHYAAHRLSLKAADALEAIEYLRAAPANEWLTPTWTMAESVIWQHAGL